MVETAPRLVGHDLVVDGLLDRQAEPVAHAFPQRARKRLDADLEPRRRDLVSTTDGGQPRVQRSSAGQHLGQLAVCLPVRVRLPGHRRDLEVRLHLGGEGQPLAGQFASGALQRGQLRGEEPAARRGQSGVRQLGAQSPRVGDQPRRIGPGLVVNPPPQRRVAGIGIHESLDEPVESEPEEQVFGHQRFGVHIRTLRRAVAGADNRSRFRTRETCAFCRRNKRPTKPTKKSHDGVNEVLFFRFS